ncbi:hypothetical protein KC318_g10276 [Hortaea werneckii]|nr:hypothetical protein KC334_g10489 [Hortaea werneckii]KAI6995361.1 hypothetical protein KC355_g10242 [Hortaea werneckii]KAI7660133.1 hypothetical protein KC318_g10276 [Hortaea werneckii]
MFGILKFQTFLLVVLLFICSCTYLHGVFPAWLDRNKSGYVLARSPDRREVESVCESLLRGYGGEFDGWAMRYERFLAGAEKLEFQFCCLDVDEGKNLAMAYQGVDLAGGNPRLE